MKYIINTDYILLTDAENFTPEGVLDSGQVFRFGQKNDTWWVISGDNRAEICKIDAKTYKIYTKNPNFFVNYFDFSTNYDMIISRLNKTEVLRPALQYGRGVRLLRQPLVEVIVNFIISANNNIPRIRKSVEKIAQNHGSPQEWGYAFPTLDQLATITKEDFISYGCGYRAEYLVDTIYTLTHTNLLETLQKTQDTSILREKLLTLKGVGPKVADCILLFGLGRTDVFPVDTWIEKVYHDEFGGLEKNRNKITKYFVQQFGLDSGYCQQYLFYYKRKNTKK